jgi:citrate lyase subunit beta / citryl-CoA lyase
MSAPRRFRSVLYVPASNARAMEKAAALEADAIILDLEDAVAPAAKAEARAAAAQVLASGALAHKHVIVRVNGFDAGGEEEWLANDLASLAPQAPQGFLFPKISTAEEAVRAHAALEHHYLPEHTALWLMIETPLAILNLPAIAAAKGEGAERLAGLVVGTNDLAKEMRINVTPTRMALLTALSMSAMAARAHDLVAIDGVFGGINDAAGFEAEAVQGKALGFDGKSLIHPSQIAPANRIFAPSEAELAEARAIIAAFEAPENRGKGVLTVNGRMAERLHYEIALKVVALD